jgi:hypothetical protein
MKELIILLILVLAVVILSLYIGKSHEGLYVPKQKSRVSKRNVKFSNITDVRMFDKETGDVLFDTIKDID